MHPDDQAELERRIRIIESPGYRDPAHADLPVFDLVLVAAAVTAVSTLLLWWGLA